MRLTSFAGSRRLGFLLFFVILGLTVPEDALAQRRPRLSDDLARRLRAGDARDTSVIVTGTAEQVDGLAARHGLRVRKRLSGGAVIDVPAGRLAEVADDAGIDQLSGNAVVRSNMAVTNEAIGATQAWGDSDARNGRGGRLDAALSGTTGRGIGVAVIDSGIAPLPHLRDRIVFNKDFTGRRDIGDAWGHGTHVAGIIAAAGRNRRDDTSGVAPDAHLLNLKVLGADGSGYAADVIEAIEWAVAHRERYAVRVINLSLGAAPSQSAHTDPLCLAIARAHDAGIVVVAAAGNRGRTLDGTPVYGTINSPGHCPHAITAGVLNTNGTPQRSDDVMASYSAKGPTRDGLIKPDLVAPGHQMIGLLAPGAAIAAQHPQLVIGSGPDAKLQLSGSSMSAAVVSGAAALLLEAEPRHVPATVRFALQYSASPMYADGLVVSGAGSLNVLGALAMPNPDAASFIAGESVAPGHLAFGALRLEPSSESATILWGNALDTIYWGNADTILWGNYAQDTIFWGNTQAVFWGNYSDDTIFWGNYSDDTILWGNYSGDTIYWGNYSADTIYWGN
jgi:serine protease AprX